jgi:hypothetical protein
MTLTRKLALALCLAFSFITLSSNSQVDSTTGNLINYGNSATDTTSVWNNGVYVNQLCFGAGQPGNCGPNPSVRPGGYINFSYGTADLNQVVNINRALAAGGTGVQLSGFNFGFMSKNGNGWDDARQDYLAAYVKLYGNSGLMANYDYSAQTNRKYNWTQFNFSETFANPVAASNYTNAQVGFIGRDNNFWAGNYGPEIFNVSFSLKYRVDPCATNPAYSPSCPKFNTVTTSNNYFNSDVWGSSVNQAIAINTALKNGGIGATVHGFNYGFDYNVGQSWFGCTATNQDGSCSWYMDIPARVSTTARLTNSSNQTLFSKNHTLTGDGTSGSVSGQYLLSSSLNQTSLGSVSLAGSTSGTGSSIGNFSTSLIYTADPCVSNPLYNTSCSGYAVAYAKNMLLGSTVASASGPIISSGSTSISTNTGTLDQNNPQPEQPQQTQQQPQQQQGPAQDRNQNPSMMTQDNPSQPSPTQQGPASTTPQPAGGPPQNATASNSSGPGGGSAGPSKLAMSVLKTAQDKDKATQNAAVASAAKTLEGSMQSSQASSNAAISMVQDMSANSAVAAATFASQSTQTSVQATTQFNQQQTAQSSMQTQQPGSRTSTQTQQQQDSQQIQVQYNIIQTPQFVYSPLPQLQQDIQATQVTVLKPPTTQEIETQQTNIGTGITLSRNMFAYNPLITPNSTSISTSASQPTSIYQSKLNSTQYEVETPQYQMSSFSGIGKAGNPLSEIIMQQRFELMQNNIAQPTSSVNRNVIPNELAGKIDIALIASVPAGFNAYSFVLKDASFYEPKEVYKNQRTVDNERVLRGLTRGSDSLHQQMVDQQYKSGE